MHDTTASVYYVPDIFVFDLIQSRVDDIHGIPVLALLETPFYGYNGLLKRLFDLFVATMILILISPLVLAIAIAVKTSSPGPVDFQATALRAGGGTDHRVQVPHDDRHRGR